MTDTGWVDVCGFTDLTPERAVCALAGGHQVAVVRTHDGTLFAVGNRDPYSGAFVLSRGIVGSRQLEGGPVPTLTSPLFKQVFDLRTGRCLDDPEVGVPVWRVRNHGGQVQIAPAAPALVDPEAC